jgi:hypothetical protein
MGRLSLPDRNLVPASGDLVEDLLVRMDQGATGFQTGHYALKDPLGIYPPITYRDLLPYGQAIEGGPDPRIPQSAASAVGFLQHNPAAISSPHRTPYSSA